MNRRGFIKLFGTAAAGLVVPELEPRRKMWFVPRNAPVAHPAHFASLHVRRSLTHHAFEVIEVFDDGSERFRKKISEETIERLLGRTHTTGPIILGRGMVRDMSRNLYVMPNGREITDEAIEAWHESSSGKPIHEFLGLTEVDYRSWVERG